MTIDLAMPFAFGIIDPSMRFEYALSLTHTEATIMTRASQIAHRWRRGLLVAGVFFELAAVIWILGPYLATFGDGDPAGVLGTPLCVPPIQADEDEYLLNAGVLVGLLLLAQWVFLLPSRLLPIRLTARGRPLRSAVIVAAAMGMLLTLGAFTLVLELFDLWKPIISPVDPVNVAPTLPSMTDIWVGMIIVWAIWALLLFRYWRDGDCYTQLSKIVRALIAGSVVEAIVAAPVQAFASRQNDCYCERGSYTTLVCSGVVLFWAFGPGIVLLFLREHYRRAKLFPHCQKRGYDLRGGLLICPECGTPFITLEQQNSVT